MLTSLFVAGLLFAISVIVYFTAGKIVFFVFVAVAFVGDVIVMAAVHRRDEARGRS